MHDTLDFALPCRTVFPGFPHPTILRHTANEKRFLRFGRNADTRVLLIKNSRRFYILMRRTTISHFSFKRGFQTNPRAIRPADLL